MQKQAQDNGSGDQSLRGIAYLHGKFTAHTGTQSKTFATRKGAERWLADRGINPDGTWKAPVLGARLDERDLELECFIL